MTRKLLLVESFVDNSESAIRTALAYAHMSKHTLRSSFPLALNASVKTLLIEPFVFAWQVTQGLGSVILRAHVYHSIIKKDRADTTASTHVSYVETNQMVVLNSRGEMVANSSLVTALLAKPSPT